MFPAFSSVTLMYILGPGRRSSQQRALALLHILDPTLKGDMGTARLETGDYKWRDDMEPDLVKTIKATLAKWVTATPTFAYDTSKSSDLTLWKIRRENGLKWAHSSQGCEFAKIVYRTYADIFEDVTQDQGRSAFHRCLEKFYMQKRCKEEGELDQLLQVLLGSLCTPCGCTPETVVDCFSFFTTDFYRAVFNFFSTQVRKNPDVKTPDRIKDREDDAKTYYICGSVWKSLHTQAKHKRNAKALLNALDGMTVDGMTAVKLGLPTRHVTMQNRGGLVFASSAYYELMNKIENRFYSTVCFT